LQRLAIKNDFMRGLSVFAAPSAAGFGFNQENAARAGGYMVNVPSIAAGQIVESTKATVGSFAQSLCHGLLTAQAKPDVLRLFETAKRPDGSQAAGNHKQG
jgi:hypothetical protein